MIGLIIAAGKGTRLKERGDLKPLVTLDGTPIIEHVIRRANHAGIDKFLVVTGYKSEELSSFLDDLSNRSKIPIDTIFNDEWTKENGISVLKAKPYLKEPFFLMMSDHLFDPEIVRKMIAYLSRGKGGVDEVVLAADGDLDNPMVDLDDVTKVQVDDGYIVDIGKEISEYNFFDTGIFHCSPVLFEALNQATSEFGDTSLSGAMRVLATRNKAKIFNVSGSFWIDIDNPVMYEKALNKVILLAE